MSELERPLPVIAIDGPAGAGKSTVARKLAERLGFVLVDTGALYRGIAWAARDSGVPWSDERGLGALTQRLSLEFKPCAGGKPRLLIDGVDRSEVIRTPEISLGASEVSKHPSVRRGLLDLQRQLGSAGGVVLEGRDIGTVVFPDAELKVFLTAAPRERAQRRVADLAGRGIMADLGQTLSEIELRDERDANRAIAPLRAAPDAVTLDTTHLDIDSVVEQLVELAQTKSPGQRA
jgi:cytidylate kinase